MTRLKGRLIPVHMTSGTALRPSWDELPLSLRGALASRLGAIAGVQLQTGGFTPGLAVRLRLADGERIFAKGIPVDHALADKYRAEAETVLMLPSFAPAPRLRWHAEIAGWVVLAFDDIDGRHADLSPGSPDIDSVVTTVAGLAPVLTPCPVPGAPSAGTELASLVHGWRELAAVGGPGRNDWTARHLDQLAAAETRWLAAADGKTLVHGDISASNLLIAADRSVFLVDWAQPVCGAPWLDVADLVPHLILAGHTPASAEKIMAAASAWNQAEPDTITSYAIAFAGYWARMSRKPAPPGVPHLRAHQAQAAKAAITWVAHRTGWS